jgi:hypothetical protein
MTTETERKRPICVLTDFYSRAWDLLPSSIGDRHVIAAQKPSGRGTLSDGTDFIMFVCRQAGDEVRLRGHEFSELILIGSPTYRSVELARMLVR